MQLTLSEPAVSKYDTLEMQILQCHDWRGQTCVDAFLTPTRHKGTGTASLLLQPLPMCTLSPVSLTCADSIYIYMLYAYTQCGNSEKKHKPQTSRQHTSPLKHNSRFGGCPNKKALTQVTPPLDRRGRPPRGFAAAANATGRRLRCAATSSLHELHRCSWIQKEPQHIQPAIHKYTLPMCTAYI